MSCHSCDTKFHVEFYHEIVIFGRRASVVVVVVAIVVVVDRFFYLSTTRVTFDFDFILNPPEAPPHVKSKNRLWPKSLNQDQLVPEKGKEGTGLDDDDDVDDDGRIEIVHDCQNRGERHLVIFWCPK